MKENMEASGPLSAEEAMDSFNYDGPEPTNFPFKLGDSVGYIDRIHTETVDISTLSLQYYVDGVEVDREKPYRFNGEAIVYTVSDSQNLIRSIEGGSFESFKKESLNGETVYTSFNSDSNGVEVQLLWWNGEYEKTVKYINPEVEKERKEYERIIQDLYRSVLVSET
ncbi:hypothetical protein [Halobacillus trueperi]|uniref:hypothetical protein n=1 Tax=Halobacillus trueperi TaxID=156205 RepID=UPI003735FB7F